MSKKIFESSFNSIIDRIKPKDSYVSYDISSLPVFLLVFSILYVMIMTILFFVIYYNIFSIFAMGISIITIFHMLMRFQKLFIGIILFVLAFFAFFYLGRIHTDVDSARYMISALIQSEAAIIAIVVTLSLVAIQQASSSYSARVIDIFKKPKTNPDFFILMGIYIFAIIYGSGVLRQIPNKLSLGIHIWIVYSLSIVALLALVPYIMNTLEMFEPTKIIELLSKNMSFSKINNAIKLEKNDNIDDNEQIQPVNDSIQPIVDVLQGSMMKYDYETTRYGLKIIEQKAYGILKDKKCDRNHKPEIASRIIGHVETIGIIAARQPMEKTVEHVASILEKFGTFMIIDDINYNLSDLISSLEKIGIIADEQKMGDATVIVISSLQNVAKTAIDNRLEDGTRKVMISIREIGLSNITSAHISYDILHSAIKSLEHIIIEVTKKWGKECERTMSYGIIALFLIGSKLIKIANIADNEKQSLEVEIIGALSSITKITIDLDLKIARNRACLSLKIIGIHAADDDIYITKDALENLSHIRSDAIVKYKSMGDHLCNINLQQIEDNIQELRNVIETKQKNTPPTPPTAS